MKAEPRQVSPSDAIEITQIFVFSFNVSTPLRTVFRTSACSCPDSHLQSPTLERVERDIFDYPYTGDQVPQHLNLDRSASEPNSKRNQNVDTSAA